MLLISISETPLLSSLALIESVTWFGPLGLAFVGAEEMRALKREHLGIDEATDVLSFPIDGKSELPAGVPRALGDVVLCPQVVADRWREPLVHGLLHLLGYDHGDEMQTREQAFS